MLNKLVIFGDSISTPLVGDGGYQVMLQELLQPLRLLNFAVAGSGASRATPDNLLGVLDQHAQDCNGAEVVLLWHGTNDWYWGSPVGTLGSYAEAEYIGAMEQAIATNRRHAPEALLTVATPLYRMQAPEGSNRVKPAWFNPNRLGSTLADYDTALRQVAAAYSLPVIDTRCLSGFCEQNSSRLLPDGIHPGKEGCDLLARIFASQITAMLGYRNITGGAT